MKVRSEIFQKLWEGIELFNSHWELKAKQESGTSGIRHAFEELSFRTNLSPLIEKSMTLILVGAELGQL